MVIAMLTPKPPVLAAIALLLLFPDAALAQARSSAGSAPVSPPHRARSRHRPQPYRHHSQRVPRPHHAGGAIDIVVAHAFGRADTAGGRGGNDHPHANNGQSGSTALRCRPCPTPCPASSRPAAAPQAAPRLPSHLVPRPGATAPASRRQANRVAVANRLPTAWASGMPPRT